MSYSEKTKKRYDERLTRFGENPKTLGWLKGRQGIRFSILTEIGIMDNMRILDVGCGFGDLYRYLKRKKINFTYTGLDLNPNLLAVAKRKYPKVTFKQFDLEKDTLDRKYDWIIISGVFNFKRKDNYRFIETSLRKLFKNCNKGIAIDFMSSYVDYENPNSFHASPEKIFNIVKKISDRITIRHDYMKFEFSVYIYKNNKSSKNFVYNEYNKTLERVLRSNKWLK